ncbi:DNA-binding domain of ModE [Caenispirillum salinarum AK4]|uniref:DNA-binding domain of ModE n=1 Tax=Caenispirillum salinarum AK4 TaxID=1238182 RepID=K9H171_9PROT|nr:winged helix-turn-helix domain-containing protein [Caenispirillum salinarum]EKV32010.1 DNA-binding domain of ModE [Caenispirillum salinarum AK4]
MTDQPGSETLRMRLRFKRGAQLVLGPGRMDLLALIDELGSISAAARRMGMSYRRAWLLVDETNRHFAAPLVESATGGQKGGGAHLTDAGREVLALYRDMEDRASAAVEPDLERLRRLLAADGVEGQGRA